MFFGLLGNWDDGHDSDAYNPHADGVIDSFEYAHQQVYAGLDLGGTYHNIGGDHYIEIDNNYYQVENPEDLLGKYET